MMPLTRLDATPIARADLDRVEGAEQELLNGMFGGPTGADCGMRQPSDAELARALAEALGAHSAVRSGRVQAGVQEHWVSLQGSATDGEWSEIERIALSVEGVSGVRLSHCDSRRRGAKRH